MCLHILLQLICIPVYTVLQTFLSPEIRITVHEYDTLVRMLLSPFVTPAQLM